MVEPTYPTGSKQVVQISAGGDDTKNKYYFRRDFVTTAASGDGLIALLHSYHSAHKGLLHLLKQIIL